jgi:hypothetical protein
MAYSECIPTHLNPLAEWTCFLVCAPPPRGAPTMAAAVVQQCETGVPVVDVGPWVSPDTSSEVELGLGRIVALHCHSPASYQIR